MPAFADLIAQGAGKAWLFLPSANLLGALHGLEPGHSKTMMAAFIVAVRGTVRQAVLLGLCATISHTLIVWAIALGGMYLWRGLGAEAVEPWLQLVSGLIVIGMAFWMLWRTRREQAEHDHHHDHHDHHHDHGHGAHHHDHGHGHHGHHHHHYHHNHNHPHPPGSAMELVAGDYQDAHERAHAEDIRRRFEGRPVTTGQIAIFGLTGGLIPCPGAITVLLICLQLKEITLGAVLVLCFSIGLALTLVASGVIAALSVRHVSRRWKGFGEIVRKAPYLSGGLILLVGVYMAASGWLALRAPL